MVWYDNCVHLYVNYLEWSYDCTIIYFPYFKVYQEGLN